jgi:hypothetical protein
MNKTPRQSGFIMLSTMMMLLSVAALLLAAGTHRSSFILRDSHRDLIQKQAVLLAESAIRVAAVHLQNEGSVPFSEERQTELNVISIRSNTDTQEPRVRVPATYACSIHKLDPAPDTPDADVFLIEGTASIAYRGTHLKSTIRQWAKKNPDQTYSFMVLRD